MRRVVLEIARTSIRALAVEGALAQPRIQALVVEPLAGEPSREVLAHALAGCRVAKARFISIIPREQVLTRLLKFPTTHADELTQMVELSGKAQLPYPREQAVADFHVVEQQAGASTVQLVACHRDLVDRMLSLLRQVGGEPSWIVPSSWGLLSWYQRLGRSHEVREPVMVINVDVDRTDLAMIREGRLLFSRSLSQGLREWQMGPDALGPIAQELERSLSSLRKELPGVEANNFLLTGLGPLDQWKGFFEQRLGKPVIARSVHGTLRLPAPASARGGPGPQSLLKSEASLAVVLGLAMAEGQWLVNLLPREARKIQEHRRRMRELTLTGVLLLTSLLLGAGLLFAYVNRQERSTSQTVKVLKELEVITEQTERHERTVKLIDGILEMRRRTAAMLVELMQLTPGEILFESLAFERSRGELVVRGSAPTTRQALDYIRRLERSDLWDRVELRYSARRSTATGSRTDFELVLRHGAS